MWFEIFKFELKYRKKRPATYIYFVIFFLAAFLMSSTEVITKFGAIGLVKENAPMVISYFMIKFSLMLVLVTSAIVGVVIIRDYEHKTGPIMFVNPIKRSDYLIGRFLGSFSILLIIMLGVLFGTIIAEFMPWRDPESLLSFSLLTYIQPFLLFFLPNAIIIGVLFFVTGALSKKMMVVYTQGVLFLVLYLVSEALFIKMNNRGLASIIDPFGTSAFKDMIKYWTVSEKNNLLIPFSGTILINRLTWMLVSVLGFVFLLIKFNYENKDEDSKKIKESKSETSEYNISLSSVNLNFGALESIKKTLKIATFHARNTFKEVAFWAIIISGGGLLITKSFSIGYTFGVNVYPTTVNVLGLLEVFQLFFFAILIFYSGELIWRERNIKFDQINDSLAIPDIITLIGKFFSLTIVYVILLLFLILFGVIIQAANGYFNFEFGLYFKTLFSETFFVLILYTALSIFIQVLVNHKFMGYAVLVIFLSVIDLLPVIGLDHSMFRFGEISLGVYSDMNKYGHFVFPFSWKTIYWTGFSVLFFVLGVLLSVRGTDSILKSRIKISKYRFSRPILIVILSSFSIFFLSGCYILYNTNVVNEFVSSDNENILRADYEKTLKKFELIDQPKIIDVNLSVEIYPEKRDFTATGFYYLKNKTNSVVKDIHVQQLIDHQVIYNKMEFDGGASVNNQFNKFKYSIYTLNTPLNPGDSIKMSFSMKFKTKGFVDANPNNKIVNNGTFFNDNYFPSIGYQEEFELSSDEERKKYELQPKERLRERDDPIGVKNNYFGKDADYINFEITIGTSKDQIAIAPGYLVNEWEDNNRKYYQYKMDQPIHNFYSIVSAKYEIYNAKWNDVNLEIYYHYEHQYNLESMMKGMKESLEYYSKFSPYQYKQLRIMEFPRYESFAQSFANTIPFSEAIGFVMNVDDADFDVPFYVTAHEVGHQWWGHQVCEANVKGSTFIGESLTQYFALMVMKKNHTKEKMQEFLRYELDQYLRGRTNEKRKELPLILVENQDYIHYKKGSLIMYAFQDYITEDSVNIALKRFINDWKFRTDIYPTSADLMPYLEAVTPDSLSYLIADFFETITLFENKTNKVTVNQDEEGNYITTIDVNCKKFRADTLGVETTMPLMDWINLGVYSLNDKGEEKLVHFKKYKINKENSTFTIETFEKPVKAGVDPLNMLIDRNPDDNVKSIKLI